MNTSCEHCGGQVLPPTHNTGTPKRFCSKKCRDAANKKRSFTRHPEKRKEWATRHSRTEKAKASLKKRTSSPEYQIKIKARKVVNHAIRDGKLVKPNTCEKCRQNYDRPDKIEAHHFAGYDRPLTVQWLCRPCHKQIEIGACV